MLARDLSQIYKEDIIPLRIEKDCDQKYILFLRDDESIISVSLAKHTLITSTGIIRSQKHSGGKCIFTADMVSQVVIMSSDELARTMKIEDATCIPH